MLHGLEKTAQSVNIMHSSQQALYFQSGSSWITKAPNLITNILILSHTQKKPISWNSLTKNEDSLCNKGLYYT